MSNEPSKDPILRGVIRHERNRGSVYGPNDETARAAFLLPDGSKSNFTPDPDGVNVNGGRLARLIYQAKMPAEPSEFGSSRSGAWLSTIWTSPPEPPTAKAVFYGYYLTAKGHQGHAALPQSNSVLVVKGETGSGQAHGKTEAAVFAAAHERVPATSIEEAHGLLDEDGDVLVSEGAESLVEEDGSVEAYVFTNGKLVCNQNVLVFDGPDIGWNHDPELDDDDGDGSLDGGDGAAAPGAIYPGYGTAWNNAGLTSGFAAGIAKARKPESGGVPWTHGYFVSKRGARAFSFRHQKSFGVSVTGFDPGDGSGARQMPYLGVGVDAAAAPLHLKGPIALEQRLERTGAQSSPYGLGEIAFHGATDFGPRTIKMGGVRLDVTRTTRGAEDAEAIIATRAGGALRDRLHVGGGVWIEGAAGGDQGVGTLNLSGLYVDGELALGSEPDAADPVVAISVARTGKGMVVKSTAPADRRFRGVQLYRHADTDDAAAAELVDFFPGRAGKKIKIVDTDSLDPGRTYFYYEASVSRADVESGLRVQIGSAVYRAIQGGDMEDGAVDLAGAKVTGKDLANIDGARAGKLDGVATGATKNVTYRQATAPAGGSYTTGDHWVDTGSSPRVHYVWDGAAWEAVGRNTTATTHLSDAGALSRKSAVDLATGDVTNKSLANVDGGAASKLGGIEAGATAGATAGSNIRDSGGNVVGDNALLNNKAHSGRGYNRNPTFQRWTAGLPDNWSLVGTPAVTRQTASPRYGDSALEVAYAAADNQYLVSGSAEIRVPPDDAAYYFVEYEVELVSGDFNRAGIWWRVNYQDSSNFKAFLLDLKDEHPTATTGKVYAGAKVMAAAVTGAPTGLPGSALLHLIGNHGLFGDTVSAKTLRWHRVEIRKATRQEIRAELALDDAGRIPIANVSGAGPLAGRTKILLGDIDAAAATPTVLGPQRLSGLVLDPNFLDPDYWACSNGGQIVTGTPGAGAMSCKAAFQADSGSAGAALMQAFAARGALIPCEPNATYSIQAITRMTAGFNGCCQVGLTFFQHNGAASAIDASEVVSGVDHTASPVGTALNENLVGTFTTPSDCDQIRVTARVNFGPNFPPPLPVGIGLIGRLRITPAASFINLGGPAAQTIGSGAVTAIASSIAVDTEGGAATDDLDTINGGVEGHILIVKTASAARVVTLKDGAGNLQLAGDFVMDSPNDRATLIHQGTGWVEIARSSNS